MLDKQVQLSSGKVAQEYSGIARDASRLVTSESAKERTLQFMNNIDVVQQRLTLIDDAMSNIDDISREARKILNSTLDGPESHQSDFIDFMTKRPCPGRRRSQYEGRHAFPLQWQSRRSNAGVLQ